MIASALSEIKPVYYPVEEKLLSLDLLKLYRREDVVQQEPEDVDLDRWLDKGKLTELPEGSLRGRERIYMEPLSGQMNLEISIEPALNIQIIPEDPEEIAAREGIHKRIQAEIHQGNKEVEARVEEMLEVPLEWNEVPDLIM